MSRIFERPRENSETEKGRVERFEYWLSKFDSGKASQRESEKVMKGLANHYGPSEKWLDEVFYKYALSYRAYAAYEVIFRQLMRHRTDKTGFGYQFEHDALEYLGVKGLAPAERLSRIESYIVNRPHKPFYSYGLTLLYFEKWGVVDKAGRLFKQQIAEIEALAQMAAQYSDGSGEKNQFIDLVAELNALKEKLHKAVKKEVQIGDRPLRGFIQSCDDGSFNVSQSKFEYFRIYCTLYYSLLEPHFNLIRDNHLNEEIGLHSFIADKINFEVGHMLNFKFTSDLASNRKRDSKSINFLETLARDLNLVDDNFYEHLHSAPWNQKLILPHQYGRDYLDKIPIVRVA